MKSDVSPRSTIKPIFVAAQRLTNSDDRQAYLREACGEDSDLRIKVEELLGALDEASSSPLDEAVERLGPARTGTLDTAEVDAIDVASHPMIGPYKLIERLGEGGMGTVYMAQQKEPVTREVALKVIKPGMDSMEVIARFEAERQALAMMDHANIAKIFDGGLSEQGRPYFVMELVRGLPIDEYCDEVTLSLRDRLQLFIEVCRAVQHAHQKGIIHRDLKPSNILITMHDSVAVVKVIDFGIAKALDHELPERTRLTHFAELVGTPAYMSPEQAELSGLDVDTRSDVYSLGVMLYKLLVGVTPFDDRTLKSAGLDEMRRIIREDEPYRPSHKVSTLNNELVSTISARRGVAPRELSLAMRRDLDWIVMKALEKDRNRRYESASDLAKDISRYLDHELVQACPPSVTYRFKKWVQRNRIAVGASSIIVVALIAISTVSVWEVLEVRMAWKESLVREQRSNDLLEATRLPTAIAAFRQSDLIGLAEATSSLAGVTRDTSIERNATGSLAGLLRSSAQPPPQRTFSHSTAVFDVNVSAVGERMVCVAANGQVWLWSLSPSSSGRILGSHEEPAHAVAISPDGTKAVSGSTTGSVWFWDLDRGEVVTKLRPCDTGIETIVWSPDGQKIAVGARYSETWVCDANGKELFRIKNDQRHESLLFAPDSSRLFVPTRQDIAVWDMKTKRRVTTFSTAPAENVRAMCWAGPQQKWLIAGERFSETLVILDRESGKALGTIPAGAAYAQHLAGSADGRWLAVTYAGGHTQLIRLAVSETNQVQADVRTQFTAENVVPDAPKEPRWTIRWLDDSQRFITAGSDGQVRLWNMERIQPSRILPSPLWPKDAAHVRAAYPLGDGELVYYFHAGEGVSNAPYFFDCFGRPTAPRGRPVSFPVVARPTLSANRVALAGPNKFALVALDQSEPLAVIHTDVAAPFHIALSDDARLVAITSDDNQVFVWRSKDQWKSAELVGQWTMPREEYPVLLSEENTLVIGNRNGSEIGEWDLASGQLRKTYATPVGTDYCVSHDRELLAVTTGDRICIWNRTTNAVVMDMSTLSEPVSLAFFPDDRVLVSGHADKQIRVWHVPTQQPLGTLFAPPDSVAGEPTCLLPTATGNGLVVCYTEPGNAHVVVLGSALLKSQSSSRPGNFEVLSESDSR